MQDFEAELKKYNAVEQRIGDVPAVRNIGALSLETQPLKAALRAEVASWKAQFARNLHKQSAEDLRVRPSVSATIEQIRGHCSNHQASRRIWRLY